jgi:CRP-like cAMP-binding protein
MDTSGLFNYPTVDQRPDPDFEFFPQGTEEEWSKLLAYTEMQLFDEGETVLKEGETGGALFLLTEGTLELASRRRRGYNRLWTATTVFGERSFLDGLPRAVTLRALTHGEMLRLSREAFDSLCARDPRLGVAVLFELGRAVSLRSRRADELLETAD